MDSDLRRKKIQEILIAQRQSLCGANTSEEDIIKIGYEIVLKIPLSLLEVNIQDGRFASLSKSSKTKIDYSSDEGKQAFLDLYWNSSNSDQNNKLLESIKNHGQNIPGIITNDGVILDGNRRFMALQKLSKKDSHYFKAYIVDPDESESRTNYILPQHYSSQKRSKYIYSSALNDFSKNQNMFPDDFTNVKFALMCDMFALNKDKSKTLRFGDFKFNEKHSQDNDVLDNYSFPSLYEFNTLDKLTIKSLNRSFFNSNNTNKTLSKGEDKFNVLTSKMLKLDGVFIDLTKVSQRYFERDPEAKKLPLSTINLIDNTNGIVAIKASEMFMAKAINIKNEGYQKSPWEDCLNNLGYFLQAVLKPNPFQNKGFYYRDSIFIFTKKENNKTIIAAPISSMFDKWKEPLILLSEIITGKKTKLKFKNNLTIDYKKFYSYSHLSVLNHIDSFPPPFDEFTKVKLKDIAISITKVSRSYQTEKAYIKFQEIVSKIKEPQKVGQLLRSTSDEVLADTNIENSLVISEGEYFESVDKSITKLPALSHHQAASVDFGNPIITPISKAIIEISNNKNYLPDKKTSWSTFSHFEIVLKKSLKSEYFAIFIQSALGQLVASSAHRWGRIGSKGNARVPHLTKKSLSDMTIVFPSLKIQDQIIDSHRKIHELKSAIESYDMTLYNDPSLIISKTIDNINEMLNLVGKLSDEERVKLMIKRIEGDTNEFKQTWRLPANLSEGQDFNKEISNKLKFGVMKVISSYLNANGGELLIGYSEVTSEIEGLEAEFDYFYPNDNIDKQKDRFMNKFNETLKDTFDDYFITHKFIRHRFVFFREKIVLFVVCKEADRPCFIKEGKAKNILGNTFYRRIGDSSDPLDGEEMLEYIHEKWPNYKKK